MNLESIRHELRLECSSDRAFSVYTGRIGEWWDPRYTRDAATLQGVTIEPAVGGRVFATHADGIDVWGEVEVWQPGHLLVHSFGLAQDPAHPSEVRVEFAPEGGGTSVRFAHGGWNESNASARAKFGDWPVLLERYRAAVLDGRPPA